MNLSKRFIATWFLLVGFLGGMLLGYMQLTMNGTFIMWAYSFIYIGFLAAWFMLFDYVKKLENDKI